MGNGGGELAHDREPRHMGELRLGVVQGFLGLFALGDVHNRPSEFQGTGGIGVGAPSELGVLDHAVRQDDPILMLERALVADGGVEDMHERRPVVGVGAFAVVEV